MKKKTRQPLQKPKTPRTSIPIPKERVRPPWIETLVDLSILVSIWLIFTLPFLAGHRTILPVDWHGVTPAGAYGYPVPRLPHFYSLDPDAAIGLEISGYKYFTDSLRAGHLPFWNPYQHFGTPYLAEGGTLVLYPFNLLHFIIPREYWDVPQFLQFFFAAMGLYLLSREYGLARNHAIVCGACALAAGHLQGILAFTSVMSAMLWTPYLLLAIERVLRTGTIRAGLASGVIGTYLLSTSCNPGLGIGVVLCVAIYAIARVWGKWSLLPRVLASLALGGLLSAPVLLPFLQNAAQFQAALSQRLFSLQLRELPAILLPGLYAPIMTGGAFGDPNALRSEYQPLGWLPPPLTFFAIAGAVFAIKNRHRQLLVLAGLAAWLWLWILGVPPFNVVSFIPFLSRLSITYSMGLVQMMMCLLAGYGISRMENEDGRTWTFILGFWFAIVIALIAIAGTVYRQVAKPDMQWVWISSGFAVLWAVLSPVILWCGTRIRGPQARASLYIALCGIVAGGIAFFPSGGELSVTVWLRLLPLAAFAILAVAVFILHWRKRLIPWLGWTLVVVPLLAMNVDTVVRRPAWPQRFDIFNTPKFVTYLQQNIGAWRSYMTDMFLFPNFSSVFGISSVDVLGSILPYPGSMFFIRFLDSTQGLTTIYGIERAAGSPPISAVHKNKRYWDYVGVRYFVTFESPAPSELVLRENPPSIWRNGAAQPIVYLAPESAPVKDWQQGQDQFAAASDLRRTAFMEGGTCASDASAKPAEVSDIRIEPNRVMASVDAPNAGTLVLVMNHARGWSARINGSRQDVYRVNGAFQGTCIPRAGKYQIVFEYEPPFWRLGLGCAVLGGILIALLARRPKTERIQ